jgi:hypothetical protein
MQWKLITASPMHIQRIQEEIAEVLQGDENTHPISAEQLIALETAGFVFNFETGEIEQEEQSTWPGPRTT